MSRLFPIQSSRFSRPHPLQIPWVIAELAYSVYAGKHGRSQSLEDLAERGGFGPEEMDRFLPDWRERCASHYEYIPIADPRRPKPGESVLVRVLDIEGNYYDVWEYDPNHRAWQDGTISHWMSTPKVEEDKK